MMHDDPYAYYAEHDKANIDVMIHCGSFLPVDSLGTKTQARGYNIDGWPGLATFGWFLYVHHETHDRHTHDQLQGDSIEHKLALVENQ
jgi:hypothetical protein